jgi:hypothetical protein
VLGGRGPDLRYFTSDKLWGGVAGQHRRDRIPRAVLSDSRERQIERAEERSQSASGDFDRSGWRDIPACQNLETSAKERLTRSLAPVSIIGDVFSLASLPNNSLDCIVAYHLLMDERRIYQALDTAARLLQPSGTLVIPIPDTRYISDAGPEVVEIF